jgi:hypothetical protein
MAFEIVTIRLLAVHGLSVEFSADKRLFGDVADEFLAFVGDALLVAHNAGFDTAFLNAGLKRTAKLPIGTERVSDTLVLARRPTRSGCSPCLTGRKRCNTVTESVTGSVTLLLHRCHRNRRCNSACNTRCFSAVTVNEAPDRGLGSTR